MIIALWTVNGVVVVGVLLWWWTRHDPSIDLRVEMTSKRLAELHDREVH